MRFLSMYFPIILALILVCCAAVLLPQYPLPPDGIAAEKYDGFSGVLTISVEPDLAAHFPKLEKWLNDITNLFEKSNRGIYLRCIESSATAADIRLCAEKTSGMPVGEYLLLPAFPSTACAVPVAADGYLLGIRGETPQSLAELPSAAIGWNDAIAPIWIALCEQFSPISTQKRTISTPDIGLIPTETPIPTAEPAAGTRLSRENLTQDASDALFSRFLAGEIRALPLNGTQVAKIRSDQSDGRYGDIRFLNAAAYTDRIAYAVIPVSSRTDGAERAAAARKFIAMLMSDAAQQRLAGYNMFPTTMTPAVYERTPGMNVIEASLRRSDCVIEQKIPAQMIEGFLDGRLSAREIMRSLRNSVPK